MIENKKGLSDIIITLLIVVLALVAIGGVWFVVRNVLSSGTGETDVAAKCLSITLEATRVNCSNPGDPALNKNCTLVLAKTGSEPISGVKLIFKNITSGIQSAGAVDVPNDVAELVGLTTTVDTLVPKANGLNSVEVVPYFIDASGNAQLCSQKTSFRFVQA
jgi:hypothetical protein